MQYRKHFIPIGLAVLAVALLVGGFGWAIATGVAIPDQHPTPTMQEYARLHGRIVDALLPAGSLALAAAIMSALVLLAQAILRRRTA